MILKICKAIPFVEIYFNYFKRRGLYLVSGTKTHASHLWLGWILATLAAGLNQFGYLDPTDTKPL